MKLTNKFPTASAAVLSTALAFLPGAFSDAQAMEPDTMVDAALFSTKGVSIIVVLGKNDSVDPYYNDLAGVMRVTNRRGVPAHIFDMRSLTEEKTTAYMIIGGVTFRKTKDKNYSANEFRDMGGDALTLFDQYKRFKAEQEALKKGTMESSPPGAIR